MRTMGLVKFRFHIIFFSLHSKLLICSFNIFKLDFRMPSFSTFLCFSFQFSYLVNNSISTSSSLHFKINNVLFCVAVSVHGFFLLCFVIFSFFFSVCISSIFIYGWFIVSPELSSIMFRLCFVNEIIDFTKYVLLRRFEYKWTEKCILPLCAFEFVAFINNLVLFRLNRIRWAIIGAWDAL